MKKPPIRCRIIHKFITYGYTENGKHCKWKLNYPKDISKCYNCTNGIAPYRKALDEF